MSCTVEFCFRVWAHPEDPADIEVWHHGLEPTVIGKHTYFAEWARESLSNEDFHELFKLDKSKHWQIVGKMTLNGSYDYFGEYNEEMDLIEFEKAEVPDGWFDDSLGLT